MNSPPLNRFFAALCCCVAMLTQASIALAQEADSQRNEHDRDTLEAFVAAAATGDLAKIDEGIEQGVDLNYVSHRGVSALQAAKLQGYQKIVERLTEAGANDLPIDKMKLAKQMLEDRIKPDAPGVAVLMTRGDQTLFEFTGGYANLSHRVPIKLTTKFRIGSVTKQFAATAILKLQEEEKLSVTDTLDKYFPTFPRADEVTIHHLLTHTSGIKSFTSLPEFMTRVTSRVTDEDVLATFQDKPYDFDPGERFQYNNSGYFLLGMIVQKVSGKPFTDYLQDEVFTPLKMHDTGIHDSSVVLLDEAQGYSWKQDHVEKAIPWDMSWAGAAGNIYSTVPDLIAWNRGLFAGKVISQASRDAAFTPVVTRDESPNAYGYGWMTTEYRGTKRITHSGGLHGFLSELSYLPEYDLSIAVLHNASPHVPGLMPGDVANQLMTIFLWDEFEPRQEATVDESADPKVFADYVGRYDYQTAVLEVTLEKDQLYAQLTTQPRFPIFPSTEGDGAFVWKVVPAKVQFLRNDKGKVHAARHTQNGITFTAKRIEEKTTIELTPEMLDRFVGVYLYPNIGKLKVRRDGIRLLAQMTGQTEFEIFPTGDNTFVWKVIEAEIEFKLNDEQQVVGATHRQGGGEIEVTRIESND